MKALLKEPLIHFMALAGVVFGIDYWVLGTTADPRKIVVNASTYEELLDVFKEGKSRLPTEAEMGAVLLKWSENEILYREAQRMGLDKGDDMIRSRLILKIRNILFSNVVEPDPTEQDLREWLEANGERYNRPALYEFEQVRLADADDAMAEQMADRAMREELENTVAEKIRRYQGRPAVVLETVFNTDDARKLINAPQDTWLPVRSEAGWHIARMTGVKPGIKADFNKIRSKLAKDWSANARQKELSVALQAIVKDYDIQLDLDAERVRNTLMKPAVAKSASAAK